MTKTYKELNEVDQMVGKILTKNPKLEETKFFYAYKRFAKKNFYPLVEEYQERLTDLSVSNALTHKETGALLKTPDEKNYEYSKEGKLALNKAILNLNKEFDVKVIEIESWFCKKEDVPVLSDEQKDLFEGLIINIEEK